MQSLRAKGGFAVGCGLRRSDANSGPAAFQSKHWLVIPLGCGGWRADTVLAKAYNNGDLGMGVTPWISPILLLSALLPAHGTRGTQPTPAGLAGDKEWEVTPTESGG